MAKKKKYYVVWSGYSPGVYDNWADCQQQVVGFPEADFKSFKTKDEADFAFSNRSKIKAEIKAKKKLKYYVVWQGVKPGIYTEWDIAKKQIAGFKHPKFKTFESREMAEKAFKGDPAEYIGKDLRKTKDLTKAEIEKYGEPNMMSFAVDAACNMSTGVYEYQGVITESGTRVFHAGPYKNGSNNIGEFLAIVHALAYLKKNRSDLPIYSDSKTAMAWVRNKAAKTMVRDKKALSLVKRAENWLHENEYPNVILKWHTKVWGEIPADFGRK